MTCVRVVIAPDAFAGTLTARQAAEAMAEGWLRGAPHDEVVLLPLSDGGAGFADVLSSGVADARTVPIVVRDPWSRPTPAVLVCDPRGTAYVEAAAACGPDLAGPGLVDPTTTTTVGVGDLVSAAIEQGAREIVVGLGASVALDAGAGLLAALGAGELEVLGRGGLALSAVGLGDLAGLVPVVERFRHHIALSMATEDDRPLLGLQGTTATHAVALGADRDSEALLESSLGHFAERVRRVVPGPIDLLTGAELRADTAPGAGASGGAGFALYLLGARRRRGFDVVADALALDSAVAHADLVVTGEGCFDWSSLQAKVVSGVAARALMAGVPAVAIVGQATVGRRESMGVGLSGVYPIADAPERAMASLTDPGGALAERTARVARTWSPYR